MKYQACSDGEYQLMIEEMIRECTLSELGYATNPEFGRREPVIVLRQPMNKDKLKCRDSLSSWAAPQSKGIIKMLFLRIMFRAKPGKEEETIKICIKLGPEVMDWLKLLISTEGELVLSDNTDDVEAILITGIPLDIPRGVVLKT